MRKTLAKLTFLGAGLVAGSSGCTMDMNQWTPEGRGLFMGGVQTAVNQSITRQVNPQRPTQVNVYNQPSSGKVPRDPSRIIIPYYIDKTLLDGSEKDKREANEVYKVIKTHYSIMWSGRQTLMESISHLRQIDTSPCPKHFREAYKIFINEFEKLTKTTVPTEELIKAMKKWNEAALNEGVRRRE